MASEPDTQRKFQGALVTSAWARGIPVARDQFIAAEDVPDGAALLGTMCFLFACFGGACPVCIDRFRHRQVLPLKPRPLIFESLAAS